MKVYLTDCISNSCTQTYVIRINAPDDDGLLTADTIANLTRMAVNMAPFVKACFVSPPQNVLVLTAKSERVRRRVHN